MEHSRRDLASLNIMRGRDNGLPDYNTVRRCFGLPEVKNWSDINPQLYSQRPELFHKLVSEILFFVFVQKTKKGRLFLCQN